MLVEDLKDQPTPYTYFLGVGDELDSIARSDKRHRLEDLKDRFTSKKVYPKLIQAEAEDYAEILNAHTKPEQWLGHITGNHPYAMTEHNIDPIQYLCTILKHPYLSYSAFVPLTIESGGHTLSFMILSHHGFGGGGARKEGAGVNAYIDHALRYEAWDLAVYGHRHDRWVKTVPRISPQAFSGPAKTLWVRAIDRKVCQCGTYMRTLSHGDYPTYSEKAGYPPRPLGCIKIRFKVTRENLEYGKRQFVIKWLGSNE